MSSGQPKVGPKLKISVPAFKRTDFSGDIERLGGLTTHSARKPRTLPRADYDGDRSQLSARGAASSVGGFGAKAGTSPSTAAAAHLSAAALQAEPGFAAGGDDSTSAPIFDEWLQSISNKRPQEKATGSPARHPTAEMLQRSSPQSSRTMLTSDHHMSPNATAVSPIGAASAAGGAASQPQVLESFDGVPLETFDSAEDFEVHTPEEWLELCAATPGRPQACVLHYISREWSMLPCWVLSYDFSTKRYLVELEDANRKHVKRLALRFNAEDAANFARRVETCRAKKAHCELQQAFINYIESQDDALVSPMLREHKERFIRQCLHKRANVEEACNYIGTIRELILEIMQGYVLSMKFAKVKGDLIEGNGTPLATVCEDSPFAPLLASFLPSPVPYLALVNHEAAERSVMAIVEKLDKEPTLFPNIWNVTYAVWRRFGEEVSRHRILDTARHSQLGDRATMRATQASDSAMRVFHPDEFISHMEEHRKDITITLGRHWRDFIVSEVLDKMSEGSNFFVDNYQKHMRSPLHRVLLKLDLILNTQMRWFVENSINDWVDFVRSFQPSPSQSLPAPLLTLSLAASHGEVVLVPEPDDLIHRLMELLDGVTKVASAISVIEYELVPFCALPASLMFEISTDFQALKEAKKTTEEVVRECLKGPQEVQAMYESYSYLLLEEVVDLDPMDVEGVRERTAAYMKAGMEIEKLTSSVVKSPFFELHCKEIIETLSSRAYYLAGICLNAVSKNIQERSSAVLQEWLETHERILSNPEDEEELAKLKQFMADINQLKTKPLMATTRHVHKQIDMLSDFSYEIEHEVVERAFRSFAWPLQIQIDVCDSERSLDTQKQKFMDKLDQEKAEFERDMKRYQEDLEWVKSLNDYSMAQKHATRIYTLKEHLDRAQERVQSFMEREKLFNIEMSDYSDLDTMNEGFEPYYKLWTAAIEFKHYEEEWLNGPLNKLNKEDIDQIVEEQFKESYKMAKQFKESAVENPQTVARDLREDIGNFRANMPVIHAICQEAFQPMHFIILFDELDTDMDMEDGLTLQQLLEIGILDHIETVERISAEAQKQHALKTALATMKKEWKPMELQTLEYKNTGTSVVKGIDDIQALLDDHIVKTQGIRGSPFVKPIEKEVKDWEAKLLYIQDLLEQWLNCQRSWLYLEPIFSSDDIQRQMPSEAKRFGQVNVLWRSTMEAVVENPNVLDVSDIENLLANFTDANKKLDIIQKGLNDYLETKRLAFPRFFFLSNEELLMILSQTKDPTAVQPHMNKCFEGINRVRFDEKSEIIEAMISVEGEIVELDSKVNVAEGEKKGNVEKWLMEMQDSMISCLTNITGASVQAYATNERTKWVLEWPAQAIIAVDNIYWTKEVAQAIEQGKLEDYWKQCVSQLIGLVNLVRGDLSKLARQTMSALVTIDVHNRDVVKELCTAKVQSPKEFDWISQLRYYWCSTGSVIMPDTEKPNPVDKLQVSIINAVLYYGFEYLGNSDRLVITNLTDRCYRTLMGAFHLYYGGAPEGPAGTGKTESTKDLAKACAVQCVVFNCSDGLDYIAMGKFFKGLASSGAWCCFDEFNRINLEVLSVISQQVATIQKAVREKKKVFLFEGTEIRLVPSCAVNITMNPGYAGRSELPDNLKALFRPCAMMVPDYSMIGEIVLQSNGFEDAKNLSRKAVGSLKLSSEQLSSQDHYDFGMRALKSILVRAGALRRMYGSTRSEAVLALSALNDVNLPKFTSNDIPLFLGITGDLFPGVELPPSDYGALIGELEGSAVNLGLQPKKQFIHNCLQLWETIMVRHGLMLVGQTVSGKTCVENVLSAALAAVCDGANYLPVVMHKINPKSITQGQLYGDFDENTHEWADGILALKVRAASTADLNSWQWVLLDGPVDAVWIENMNTVLDDNKKLCLNSGEIIKLSTVTRMMFEVEDLAAASPATVSRCGMVFMEQANIGWEVLLQSWCDVLPERVQEYSEMIKELFLSTVDCSWEMLQRKVKQPVPVNCNWMVHNMLKLYLALMVQELKLDPNEKDVSSKEKELKLDSLFWLALFWSFGAATDEEGQEKMDTFFRLLMLGQPVKEEYRLICAEPSVRPASKLPLPETGTCFEYFFHGASNKWELWTKKIAGFDIPKDAQMHTIIVPTTDTVRNAFLLQTLVRSERHVLFSGLTGTGKTVIIQQELLKNFDRDRYTNICFAFSAQTTANQTQDIIDGKLDKRRKGTYGPPLNKRCLVFVDDLNMPAKETYGAQPPIELLRQWMDTGGWYERKTCEERKLVDLNFIAAMGPPGAGRPMLTARYKRHYNLVFVVPFKNESLQRIFTSVMNWFLSRFPSGVSALGAAVVKAGVDVYEQISASMRPTPAKSHYTFNLRDLSKVHQGLCLCSKHSLPAADDLIKCWAHECQRVFQDRLINKTDQVWFNDLLKKVMDSHFKKQWKSLIKVEPLIWGDFVDSKQPYYQEVVEHTELTGVLDTFLMDYNSLAKRGMELVLFMAAVQHVCRIVRVLKIPLGNAMLVGVGGSGRKSMATLATFVAEYESFQIEISKNYSTNDWHEDIKRLLMRVGAHAKEVTFLLADTQIPKETFLEDTSSLLNNGEVPNLFNAEDKTQILEACTAPAAQLGRTAQADIFAFFNEQCRRNLHVVLALSPIGEAFRRRVRMFPSLVNCCTIDWFMEWPDDALRGVADHFLHKVELAEDVFRGVVEICVEMQKSVFALTERFFREVQRHYYVTPTSYLELINSFKDVLQFKRNEVLKLKRRYDEGLEKLITTEEQVSVMSKELAELRPVLKKTSADTQELMVNIEQKQHEAKQTQAVVSKEEEVCSQQAEEARVMKEECQADLDKALPALNAALDALKNLKKNDIVEVKNLKTPPDGVVVVSKAMCWCFDVKPKKVTAADGRTKIDDYWEPAKKSVWGDPKLIDRMLNFDKDNIPEDIIAKLKPLSDDPQFDPEIIKKASVAAFGICKWVRAMVVYDGVAKVVQPKKNQLASAEETLAKVMGELNEKKAQLKLVQDNVAKLLSEFETAKKKKDDLEVQVDECSKRLVRAEKLITGLGGEKTRWSESSTVLGEKYNNITGDVLISSGIVAYLGTFMGKYRGETVGDWISLMHDNKVPASQEFSLRAVIGEEVTIRQWVIDKLPNDQVSIENALILSKSRRWPLMIDPQLQANQWIRKSNADNKLRIIRLNQANYARVLENAISYGEPVLLENVGETLDPLLEPLLQKAKFKAGNIIMIRLGDSTIEYSEDFKLYITTKLPNPHYSPEICVQVTLLNFMATPDGLEDQMLGILVAKEEPEVERKRQNLIVESAQSKAQLKEIEDRILELLSNAKGNILDDEELINTLATSKVASQRIEERVAEQEKTQALVQETRESYVPVAVRASALFFVISELCVVEPMYQYSLEWFINMYLLGISTAEKFDRNIQKRLVALQKQFVKILYEKVCDSLFEKDKLMFSLLLGFKSMEVDNELNHEEKNLLLLACNGTGIEMDKPNADWLTQQSWQKIGELDKLNKAPWQNFANLFKQKLDGWKAVFDSEHPLEVAWPGGLKETMTPLQRALILCALRTDCTISGIQEVITAKLGKEFLEPPSFNLEKTFNDSTSTVPLIFVLSSGADPMAEVYRLGYKLGTNDRQISVSLGQGQGPKAHQAVVDGMDSGFWVILQNCHLAPSWMTTLEILVEELTPEKVQDSFRLWLTAMPSPEFPVSVLQNGLKMTNEPPKGLKSNLLRAYLSFENEWFEEACMKNEATQHAFRKMLFGLCFFHALIQERANYGPLGWNIPYQFSEPDRQICVSQLRMFLEENDQIPYAALCYTAAEANYGGRVTDTHDRRCIAWILTDFYCPDILKDEYKFSPSGTYYAPPFTNLKGYIDFIRSLPINQMPEAFGLHANANLAAAISEALRNLATACSMQPKSGGSEGGQSSDSILMELSTKFLGDLPHVFDTEAVNAAYPIDYHESMNTTLRQELLRFNKLLAKIRATLADIGKAVKGLVVMSAELEEVANGILQNSTPPVWKKVSYPSLKPLASYVADLCARLKFLQDWVDQGVPITFWLSGFYFTQSFLTGQLQNYARKSSLAIDGLIWTFKVLKHSMKDFKKPPIGCFVYGLFMDGARWDDGDGVIAESYPKVLFDSIPHLHLVPCEAAKDPTDKKLSYASPLYKTSERKGTLSTTGHSTNFVMTVLLPISKQHTEKYWTKRGVACLTQLDD